MSEVIKTRREGAILEVTLDRPKANAIDLATSRLMGLTFQSFRDDPELRVAIVKTAGEKFFSAGWDLKAAAEGENCIANKLPIPAYEQAIKASHIFNTLQARGVISVAERQAYIGRVRDLAKGACAAWMEKNGWPA